MNYKEILKNLRKPTPRLAGKFSTWNPQYHAEGAYPQNCMYEQARNQISDMHFDKFLDPSTFECWKTSFETGVCSCSNCPTEAVLWIKEIEVVESVIDIETSQSIGGRRCPNFEMLDAKMASALKKIFLNSYFKKVSLEEQKGPLEDRFLRGRQVAIMIYEYFRVTGAHEAVLDHSIFRISLHRDDVLYFHTRWDEVLLLTSEVPNDAIPKVCK